MCIWEEKVTLFAYLSIEKKPLFASAKAKSVGSLCAFRKRKSHFLPSKHEKEKKNPCANSKVAGQPVYIWEEKTTPFWCVQTAESQGSLCIRENHTFCKCKQQSPTTACVHLVRENHTLLHSLTAKSLDAYIEKKTALFAYANSKIPR